MEINYNIPQNSLTKEMFDGDMYVRKNRSKYSNMDCVIEKISEEIEDAGACKMPAGQWYQEFWEQIAQAFVDKGYFVKLKYRRLKQNPYSVSLSHIVVSKLPLFDNSNYYMYDRIIMKKELREAI